MNTLYLLQAQNLYRSLCCPPVWSVASLLRAFFPLTFYMIQDLSNWPWRQDLSLFLPDPGLVSLTLKAGRDILRSSILEITTINECLTVLTKSTILLMFLPRHIYFIYPPEFSTLVQSSATRGFNLDKILSLKVSTLTQSVTTCGFSLGIILIYQRFQPWQSPHLAAVLTLGSP